MSGWLTESTSISRFVTHLLGGFAVIGLALAAIGIYGVLSYVVGQQLREIGIRMALGAAPVKVGTMVLRRGLRLAVLGLLLGLPLAYGAASLIGGLLGNVSPRDPVTLVGVCAVLLAAAFLACALPAGRAARQDPVSALRSE
jgi:ABC-type antimicrobial peptide transport system permease subunit